MTDPRDGGEPPWSNRLLELLLPEIRDRIERLGVDGSGAYNFYDARAKQGRLFLEYELALANRLLSCGLTIDRIDEIGSGFGQLMFLLGWNGFKTTGFEADGPRASTATALRDQLNRIDPERTANIRLFNARFPFFRAPRPGPHSLLLTTNIVSTCTDAERLAILKAMRRYPFVLSDVQRCLVHRPEPEQEPEALAMFAQAGFGRPELFLDLGQGGRYFLFAGSPRRDPLSMLRRYWRK
jgi:hypothetical protein